MSTRSHRLGRFANSLDDDGEIIGLANTIRDVISESSALVLTPVDYTAKAGERVWALSPDGVRTITLPATPVDGEIVTVVRYGPNNVDVVGSISGVTGNLTIDIDKTLYELTFVAEGWFITSARSIV